LFLFFGCESEDHPTTIEEAFQIPEGVKEPLAFAYMIHDVEGIVFNNLFELYEHDRGTAATHEEYNIFNGRGACAIQTFNPVSNELILSFGAGCTDDNQNLRKGLMTVHYTDPEDGIGNEITIDLEQFFFNSLGLNGQIKIINTSQVQSSRDKSYEIVFTNLELFIDSEKSEFSGKRMIDYSKEDGRDFETTTMDYHTQNDFDYITEGGYFNLETSSTNYTRLGCWFNGFFQPSIGKELITSSKRNIEIDYGTGGCNYILNLTFDNKEPRTFDLSAIL